MSVSEQLRVWFTTQLPNAVQALLILVLGALVAFLLAAVARSLMTRLRADDRLNRQMQPNKLGLTNLVSQGVFWLVLLFAIVAALDALGLSGVSGPFRGFLDQIIGIIPNLIGAGVLAAIAWIVATVIKRLIEGALGATNWDERLRQNAGMDQSVPLGASLGTLAYWLIWLLFLPAILDVLGLQGLLAPVQELVNDVLAFLPNLFAAAAILLIGYFVARIVRDIVTNLLASTGVDRVAERVGFGVGQPTERTVIQAGGAVTTTPNAPMTLSRLIGLVVFALILIPVAITALDALNLQALSQPAIAMLNQVLDAIPNIFAAVVLLAIAYFAARLIADIVSNILAGIGFDRVLQRIGLTNASVPGQRQPSDIVGTLLMVGILLFAATEAANLLGFEALASLVTGFLLFFGNVVLGLVVLGLGLYLANLAADMIRSSGMQNSDLLATVARYAIILLAIFMALQQMGIAVGIVTLAFGLILGALAIAVAIAFGLGGRDIAQRELDKMLTDLRERPQPPHIMVPGESVDVDVASGSAD